MRNSLLIFFLLLCTGIQAQVLTNTNLNLNVGGKIHDVAYDSYYDAYIVVGNFTSINGQARNNLAFIDAQTLDVLPYNPITSIDGEIRTIALYSSIPVYTSFPPNPNNPDGQRYYMYLGGNFNTINSNTLPYLARFSATHMYASPPVGGTAPYSINSSWSINGIYVAGFPQFGVYDLHLDADTLVVAGEFYSQETYYPSGQRNFLSAYDVTTTVNDGWINLFPENAEDYNSYPVYSVEKFENEYYMSILDEVFRYTSQGVNTTPSFDYQYTYSSNSANVRHVDFSTSSSGESVIYSVYDKHSNGYAVEMDSINHVNTISANITSWDGFDIEVFNDYVFSCHSATSSGELSTRKLNASFSLSTPSSFALNNNWQASSIASYTPQRQYECLFKRKNLLFLSGSNLNTVDGAPRTGLAVFCLEPSPAESFTQSDPSACEEDSSIYTIPQAQCADGYRWTYTGSGAMYRITGSGNPWAALSSNDIVGTTANSIEVYFPTGATSGMLTVEPFTLFATSEHQYSQGQSVNVTVNLPPDITLAPSHTLNCYSDTVFMVAQSSMPNVSFDWTFNGGGNTSANDSIIITSGANGYDSSYYHLEVTNPLTGCASSDSTYFTFDTTAVLLDVNLTTTSPLEWTCLTDSMVLTSNQTGYSIQWEDQANPGTFYSDPFTIYSAPSSLFNIRGVQLSNGCLTQAEYGGIVVNTQSADPVLIGHPNFVTDFPDDSLSCANPTLTLQCDVDPAYSGLATAQWTYQGTPLGTDILNLTTADSAGMDGLNLKYYSIITTHSSSQCLDSAQITVRFDLDVPYVDQLADQSINCSQSEILLTHPQSGFSNVVEGWLDSSGTQTAFDTLTATSTGDYYYQVQSLFNGCTNTDTVSVNQSLDLLLDMPQDTLICPDQVVTIAPVVLGNSEAPLFAWSTGSNNSTELATGGVDSLLIVTVSTPSGCIGVDSTIISITAPVQATITPFIGCTDGSLEVTGVIGGAGNYQYSLDQSTWQTSTNFAGLSFGSYTVSIQDDLGCIYGFNESLDGTASSIELQFDAATYNEEGDTIVLVNTTDFTGLDSVSWILPPLANVTFESDSLVILSISDSGWYDVELIGYIGTDCEYSYIAPVFFGGHSPIFDTTHTSNGIQSFVVNPNPTTGSFNVAIEFGTAQNYTIMVTNSLGQPVQGMNTSGVGETINESFVFPLGTPAGSYRIHVIADYDAAQKLIILN